MRRSIRFFAFLVICAVVLAPAARALADPPRPRLFMDAGRLAELKGRLRTPPYNKFWAYTLGRAKSLLDETPPASLAPYDDNTLRPLGDTLPWLAMAYVFTGDAAFAEKAVVWMDLFALAPKWASDRDIGAAHVLFGMAVAYDWLYDAIPAEKRVRFRKAMARRAETLDALLENKNAWWARDPLQNHNHACAMALVAAGVVLEGESPAARKWLQDGFADIELVLQVMPRDGASSAGVGYWSYSLDSLLKGIMAAAPQRGLAAAKNSPYLSNTAMFRLYASLPGYAQCVDYADSPRIDYKGPGRQLRALARIFKDSRAQWLADRIERARGGQAGLSWLDILWFDPSVPPKPPNDLPTHRWFPDLGLLLARTSWTGDGRLAWFKAGPAQGRAALSRGLWTGAHIHPDAGSYGLYSHGHWVVQDDGYVEKKLTSNHNTLIVGPLRLDTGTGQLGEGGKWLKSQALKQYGADVETLSVDLEDTGQIVRVELSGMYPPEAGLRSFERAFAVIDASFVLVRDIVETRNVEAVQDLVHLGERASWIKAGGVCLGEAGYHLQAFAASASYKLAGYKIQTLPLGVPETRTGMLFAMGEKGPGRLVLAYALAPAACGEEFKAVRYDPAQDVAYVRTGRGEVVVDFARGVLKTP
jgi:hypothetical protein